jgi:hypothetical protein
MGKVKGVFRPEMIRLSKREMRRFWSGFNFTAYPLRQKFLDLL